MDTKETKRREARSKVREGSGGDEISSSSRYSLDDKEDAKAIGAVAGSESVKKIFSANQEDLVEAKTKPRLDWDQLQALGPVKVMKWEFEARGLDLVAERWDLAIMRQHWKCQLRWTSQTLKRRHGSWSLSSMKRDCDRTRIRKRRPGRSSNISLPGIELNRMGCLEWQRGHPTFVPAHKRPLFGIFISRMRAPTLTLPRPDSLGHRR